MNWQPIETAPKDGTVIDLWIEHTSTYDGSISHYRSTDCKFGVASVYKYEDSKPSWLHWDMYCEYLELVPLDDCQMPTHWMPLPEPPCSA